MNGAQMLVVLLILSLLVSLYLTAMGVPVTYLEALAGLAVLKGIALFLVPEKAPMVLVKDRSKTEEEDSY